MVGERGILRAEIRPAPRPSTASHPRQVWLAVLGISEKIRSRHAPR